LAAGNDHERIVLRHEAASEFDPVRADFVIWHESGGRGDCPILFLHGLGATAAVWSGARQALEERGGRRWVMLDLAGHGGSDWQPFYSAGQLAGQIAQTIRLEPAPLIVGHSLGAYVGLALASGWFGIRVRAVLGIGPKITWPEADLEAARGLAARPVRCYATEDEAVARYRRVSGLGEELAPGREALARGVLHTPDGWRLAQDPGTFAAAGAPFASLASAAQARVALARGERDPMVSLEELRAHAPLAYDIRGAGHNAHVEDPRAVLELIEVLLSAE
jgi:pimeloyl-ACP methyl ester carboxylesterase